MRAPELNSTVIFQEAVSKARFTAIARSKAEAIQFINNDLWIASCFVPRSRNDEVEFLKD
jgi:hypothetical protein